MFEAVILPFPPSRNSYLNFHRPKICEKSAYISDTLESSVASCSTN